MYLQETFTFLVYTSEAVVALAAASLTWARPHGRPDGPGRPGPGPQA